jgi:AcrR family transcriptional regulator
LAALSPKKRRQAQTRSLILREARRLIAEAGPERLSIRELARRIDYSPAGLYSYFRGKAQIVAAVRAQGLGLLAERLRAVPERLSWHARLLELGLAYIAFAREDPEQFLLLFTRLPSGRRTQRDPADAAYRILQDAIRRGCREGGLKTAGEPGVEELSFVYWAQVHGLAMLELGHLRDFRADFEKLNRLAIERSLRGLAAEAS